MTRPSASDIERMSKRNSEAWGKVLRPSPTLLFTEPPQEPIKRSKHGSRKTAVCCAGAWEENGGARTCADCGKYLGPVVAQPAAAVRQRDPGKRSKHGSRKIIVDGEKFDSQLEARCYRDLNLREKAGEVRNLRRQVKFSLFMNGGEHYGVYKADFVFDERVGFETMPIRWQRVVADTKSEHTRKLPAWQKVKKLLLACHGITVKELP